MISVRETHKSPLSMSADLISPDTAVETYCLLASPYKCNEAFGVRADIHLNAHCKAMLMQQRLALLLEGSLSPQVCCLGVVHLMIKAQLCIAWR